MAGNFNLEQNNSYASGMEAKIAANSAALESGDAVKLASGFVAMAGAGDTIEGISVTKKTFASDNQTVAMDKAIYHPSDINDQYRMRLFGATALEFSGDLVTSNTINLKVNGVAMTQVTFSGDNATTLGLIATQLETDFPTVIESALAVGASDKVLITVVPWQTVTLSEIVVAAGAGQATGSQVDNFAQADIGDFYDIKATTQFVDGDTNHASSGQLKFEEVLSQSFGIFSIANT